MSAPDAKFIATLATAHAAIGALLLELTESPPEAPASPVPDTAPGGGALPCQHPHRKELAPTFGSMTTEHWVCEDCGYEYRR